MKRKDFVYMIAISGFGLLIGCIPPKRKLYKKLGIQKEIMKLNNELKYEKNDDLFRKKSLRLLKLKDKLLRG